MIDRMRERTGVEMTEQDVIDSPHIFIGSIDRFVEKFSRAARAARDQLVPGRLARRARSGGRAARRDLTPGVVSGGPCAAPEQFPSDWYVSIYKAGPFRSGG